jgi:hypothetical protein
MVRPQRRTFTLRDGIVLIGAVAIGLAWLRSLRDFDLLDFRRCWLHAEVLGVILVPLTMAVAALRLLRPRPALRRLFFQPGAAACAAVAFAVTIAFVYALLWLFVPSRGIPWGHVEWDRLGYLLYHWVVFDTGYHASVVAAWGVLLASGRWRPEPSWIDRTARAIGCIWLLQSLGQRVDFAVEAWRTGP